MVESRFRFTGRCVTGCRSSESNPRVAPNFTLRELSRPDGSYFIHPNLILTLQNIRSLLGESVRVLQAGEDGAGTRGFCAVITATNTSQLKEVCSSFVQDGAISMLTDNGHNVSLEARPSPADTLALDDALDAAFYVTAGFETQGDPFQQVTGNFDGAGLSFGPSQVNFKTRTLVALFRRFEEIDGNQLQACFANATHWDEWRAVCDKPPAQQVIWADDLSWPEKAIFQRSLAQLFASGRARSVVSRGDGRSQ